MAAQAIPVPRKAEKRRVKLKIAIQGPSGSGKTDGALALAKNLVPNGKILLVDTENESASLYADRYDFDTIPLAPPYQSIRFEACIDTAVRDGYDVLILDTITPQWDGDGGILRRKEELDKRPNSNSFTNWATFTPEHTRFIEKIKQAPIHIIATMRSKTEYILQDNSNGKKVPRKVGTSPIQRDGFEYEFSIVFDVQMDHRAIASKDRTTLFGDDPVNLRDTKLADGLREWLEHAKPEATPETITGELSEQRTQGGKTWWNVNGSLVFCDEQNTSAEYSRLLDQVGKTATVTGWFRKEHDGKKVYELAEVVKVEAPKTEEQSGTFEAKVVSVTEKTGKLGKFLSVWTDRKESPTDKLSITLQCFHKSLEPALQDCEGRVSKFLIKRNGAYLNIEDVLEVDGISYKDGKIAE